jgi:ribosome-associated protein
MEAIDRARECGRLALDKKARNVVLLELSGLTDIADFFVLASGGSERHVKTISDGIQQGMKGKGMQPQSAEGYDEGRWIIMDYGDVIVHVFLEDLRELYDLESLWIEAKKQTMD